MQEGGGLPRRPSGSRGDLTRYSGLGITWVLTVVLLGWGGLALDGRLGTDPLLMLVGALLGIVGGFYRLYLRLVVEPENMESKGSGRGEGNR